MNRASRLHLAIAASAFLGSVSPHTHATPVSVSNFSFTPGIGYGVDANEGSGTRLDVLFSSRTLAQNAMLVAVGDSWTFDFGSVTLREPNSKKGILDSETDHLDLSASLTLNDPIAAQVRMLATGAAAAGSVSDADIDFTIDWNPVQLGFGAGGWFEIELTDLRFTGPETLAQTATITLLRSPLVARVAQVPEPGSLVLAGLALAGLAVFRRSRRH